MICSSGIGFDPVLDGRRLTFGFQGIHQGVALLYDHPTDSLWLHLTGECIAGPLAGRTLARLATGRHTTWADWRRWHPETTVLAPEARWMNQPLDQGYLSREAARSGAEFLPGGFRATIHDRDERLAPSALVYGVRAGGVARAYPLSRLAGHAVVEEDVGGVPVSLWFDLASRSAVAYDRRLDAHRLSFLEDAGGRRRDRETGSLWTLEGRCESGPLAGRQLRRMDGLLAEWYGWYAHHPDTGLWLGP